MEWEMCDKDFRKGWGGIGVANYACRVKMVTHIHTHYCRDIPRF